ncbi:MAG: GNAT family N-acetyltransferase [Candidatus Thorarchaeota archaeon]|jgi:GNAT superfamily N-acetyltransferase
MEIELRPFDPFKATEEDWKMYHQFRYKRYAEMAPGDPITADDAVESSLRFMRNEAHIETHTVHLKGKPEEQIGRVRMTILKESSASYEENKHICHCDITILTPHRGKGIAKQILETVLDFVKRHEKDLIIGGTSEDDGKRFIRKLKADEALSAVENRLDLTQLDWNMVEEWSREGADRSPDTKLEFFQDCPDDILEEYCKFYTEVGNQAPREGLQVGDFIMTPKLRKQQEKHRKDVGATWLTAITREPNGDISGMTEVIYFPSKDPHITQDLTGVSQKYRGSGKGKWLKAIMLQEVRKRFPTVTTVVTGNATTNAPMLSINERLGFKVHREDIIAQLKTEDLEKYLAK